MLTTDLALRFADLRPHLQALSGEPDEFADAFAKAWFKLTHRDMGPYVRGLGKLVPPRATTLAGPRARTHARVGERARHCGSQNEDPGVWLVDWPTGHHGLGLGVIVPRDRQAWRRQRCTNSARTSKDWEVNTPDVLAKTLAILEGIQSEFNRGQSDGTAVSLADVIVLGGCAAVEQAAKNAGYNITVPFTPGRTDASQDETDVESFEVLEPPLTASATISARMTTGARKNCLGSRPPAHADRARNDGSRGWHACPRYELRPE